MKILILISGLVAMAVAETQQERQEHHILVQELHKTFKLFDVSHLGYLPLSDFLAYFDRLTKGFNGTVNLDAYTKLMHLPPDIAKFYFRYYDMNDDGELTKDIDIRAVFHMFDHNHNGQVSEHEFVAEAIKIHQEMAKRVSGLSLEFVAIDGNGDGFITVENFQKFYDIYDLNHDGRIDLAEFIKSTHLDATTAGKLFNFEDSNHDNVLDRQTDVQALITNFDTNGDGKLDYAEYVVYATKLRALLAPPIGK
ncbi:uncharacterized protein LOC121384200 [Gigantopelta aegis]|uniref:uncharacterized protein LOC121384200 n=1 Tax=Gigantopelta aegis TaxID=1735272 RepID=UPI001B88803C|nr:uncharacterized protein LOC121384200 [Gigantopelta aegis]